MLLDGVIRETKLGALIVTPNVEAARLVYRIFHGTNKSHLPRWITLSDRVDGNDTHVVDRVGLKIYQLEAGKLFVGFGFCLVKHVHIARYAFLRHLDIVENDLFIVIAWFVPLNHYAIVE